MKISSPFHILVFYMAFLVFSMPLVTLAQQSSVYAEAIAAAEADAEANVNRPLWFAVGCLFTSLGTVGAYVIEPSPPASRLIGKSPEYVAFYTEAYKAKAKGIQGRTALTGCLISGAVSVVSYIFLVGVFLAAESTY